jgi:Ala-tRNA(Pro) deacylase
MTMTTTLQKFLTQNGIDFDIIPHRPTSTSINTAQTVHINGKFVAKSVILEDELGYLMAVVPASEHVMLDKLNKILDRQMELAPEAELTKVFFDCEPGAIPPIGSAYGIQSIIDEDLLHCSDIYFEAGNHRELVHVNGHDFKQLMEGAPHSKIAMH